MTDKITKSTTKKTPPEATVHTPSAPATLEPKPVQPMQVNVSTETTTTTLPTSTTVDPQETAMPTTTSEENRHASGQRNINLIWEFTQALIALSVIFGTIGAAIWITIYDSMNRLMAFLFMSNIVSIVVGFYFGRTNHQRVGGVQSGR